MFTSDDFLTANQIAGFFSRMAMTMSDDDLEAAASEARIQELTNAALNDLAPRRPITYDAFNLCEMAPNSKLKSFSISVLKDICLFLTLISVISSFIVSSLT